MSARLARLIIRACAPIVPAHRRAGWREEWLAELSAGSSRSPVRRAFGAPADALSLRNLLGAQAARRSRIGADVRHTARWLAKSPGYVTIATLGVGIGLTAVVAVGSAIVAILHADPVGLLNLAFWLGLLIAPALLGLRLVARFRSGDELPPLAVIAFFFGLVSVHYEIPIYLTRGTLWLLAGENGHARSDYERALAIDPENAVARQALQSLMARP